MWNAMSCRIQMLLKVLYGKFRLADCYSLNLNIGVLMDFVTFKSLKQHYSAYVSKEVDKLNNLMSIEYQLDDAFENNTYNAVC